MKYTLLISALLLIIACTEQPAPARTNGYTPELKTKEDSLLQEVMDGHDMGMSRMMKLSKYLTKTNAAIDSIKKLPAAKRTPGYLATLETLKEELEYADNSMNTWMVEFKRDSAATDKERRIQYLEGERAKIAKVKEAILGSLGKADSLFNKK